MPQPRPVAGTALDGPAKRRAVLVLGLAGAVLLTVGLIAYDASRTVDPARLIPGTDRVAVADGDDPGATGCSYYQRSVESLDRAAITTAAGVPLGTAVLRYSPRCRAAWGRFEPAIGLTGPVRLTITVDRPATGTLGLPAAPVFDGNPTAGTMLLETTGCVRATVRVETPGGGGQATTRCVRTRH